ncbi:single-stranded-DNA-specific exonuclease RecJ [candidate division Kazan bacterium]|uniref:Single-stranded-DNA-specific exonuclease RecJ n=1 Tax=candidate division Kazan bacterium TaxID=2202143 RepID=A0A420ZD76_UNCK3|nr:MAG: single-stranded-DNA-specific exonuclease RecJ [candidate division Kazan bacterium]
MVITAGVKSEVRFNVADIQQDIPVSLRGFDFITAQLLLQRGIRTKEAADKFLSPKLEDLGNPSLFKDLDKAVARIKRAIAKKEHITVYGDYDVDGITSATILISVLKTLKAIVNVYLPERLKEGYGLNKKAIKKLREKGTDLLITVDNGTTNIDEIAYANKLGMDVIVVDHHQIGNKLPLAYALINPHRPDDGYPDKNLAAVGIVYHLVRRLIGDGAAVKYLDLVALGTVADVVPLIGDNRIFTVFGLKKLNKTERIGLKALIDVASLKGKALGAYHIGFQLGPRINAAGRIDHAAKAFALLNETDEARAYDVAHDLNSLNTKRQKMTEQILESALVHAGEWDNKKIIIVGDEGWSIGVAGIVAGRLTEKYSKPSMVFEYQKDICRGSARSVDGVHLIELLNNVDEYIQGYGGHAKAAGVTIKRAKFEDFKKALEQYALTTIHPDLLRPSVNISLLIEPNLADSRLFEIISRLAPFGFGNPTPVFGMKKVKLESYDAVGNAASIIRMIFSKGEQRVQITGFDRNGELILSLQEGSEFDVAFTISGSEWSSTRDSLRFGGKPRKFIDRKLVQLRQSV